jgi:hypothetical protein
MATTSNNNERRDLPSLGEVADGKHFQAISHSCVEKATSYDSSVELFKENIDRHVQKLAVRLPRASSKLGSKSGVAAPESKYVFQDKENFEGMRHIDSKRNENVALRKVIDKSKRSVIGSQDLQLVKLKQWSMKKTESYERCLGSWQR